MSNGVQAQTTEPAFVYAIGRIEHRFPNQGLEKEFAQARARIETKGLTDWEVVHKVLSDPQNRYLARQLCWVLSVEGLDAYLLQPRDPLDFDRLIDTLDRPYPSDDDVDVVIGLRGPIAPAGMCNGLMVPVVYFDQIYSFDTVSLVKAIPKPQDRAPEQFEKEATELFKYVAQMTDNAGSTDEHRALNYLAVRYPDIYHMASGMHLADSSLTGVEVRPSRLSGTRSVLDVIFSFTNRQSDVIEKRFVRVDVTDMFPFLVTKLSPFYER